MKFTNNEKEMNFVHFGTVCIIFAIKICYGGVYCSCPYYGQRSYYNAMTFKTQLNG